MYLNNQTDNLLDLSNPKNQVNLFIILCIVGYHSFDYFRLPYNIVTIMTHPIVLLIILLTVSFLKMNTTTKKIF